MFGNDDAVGVGKVMVARELRWTSPLRRVTSAFQSLAASCLSRATERGGVGVPDPEGDAEVGWKNGPARSPSYCPGLSRSVPVCPGLSCAVLRGVSTVGGPAEWLFGRRSITPVRQRERLWTPTRRERRDRSSSRALVREPSHTPIGYHDGGDGAQLEPWTRHELMLSGGSAVLVVRWVAARILDGRGHRVIGS